jgi:hypothetical protein
MSITNPEAVADRQHPATFKSGGEDRMVAASLAKAVFAYVMGPDKDHVRETYAGTPAEIAVDLYFECLDAIEGRRSGRKAARRSARAVGKP